MDLPTSIFQTLIRGDMVNTGQSGTQGSNSPAGTLTSSQVLKPQPR